MSHARKEALWSIKKKLYHLSGTEAYEIAMSIGNDHPGADKLSSTDEESCIDHILSFMLSDDLLKSEDEGVGHLMNLNDVIVKVMKNRECFESHVVDDVTHASDSNVPSTHSGYVSPTHTSTHTHTY